MQASSRLMFLYGLMYMACISFMYMRSLMHMPHVHAASCTCAASCNQHVQAYGSCTAYMASYTPHVFIWSNCSFTTPQYFIDRMVCPRETQQPSEHRMKSFQSAEGFNFNVCDLHPYSSSTQYVLITRHEVLSSAPQIQLKVIYGGATYSFS